MNRPLGLSSVRRFNRQTMRIEPLRAPIPTRPHAPFLRVSLAAALMAALLTGFASCTGPETVTPQGSQAIPGASPEINEAFLRGLRAGMSRNPPKSCNWNDLFEQPQPTQRKKS